MPVPDGQPAPRVLLRDTAYEAIHTAIIDGTLQPGERLRDQELCRWLGLSRTPIREALSRLEDEGLVEMRPQSFTRVAPLRRDDAREAYPIIAALHALATELAVPRATAEDLARLRDVNGRFEAALDAGDVAAALAADDAFHGVFVAIAGNAELSRTLDRLVPRLRRLERVRFASLPGRRSVRQHSAIVTLAAKGAAADAAAAVRENWLTLGDLIDRSFPNEETA